MVERLKGMLDRLGSRRLALALFAAVCGYGVYGSLLPAEPAQRVLGPLFGEAGLPVARFVGLLDTYRSPAFVGLLALFGLNLLACTATRFVRSRAASRRAAVTWLDLLMHLSILVVLAGGAAKGLWSSTVTSNVRVGDQIAEAYDWRRDAEVPLGFAVAVGDRRTEYYPAAVRVGVRAAASREKLALLELGERAPARVPGHDLSLELTGFAEAPPRFRFAAARAGAVEEFELEKSAGGATEVTRGPYVFTLVAFRHEIKSVRGLVRLLAGNRVAAEGWLGSNERLEHDGTSVFLTAWGADEQGRPFIGLQFVRDPGSPVFWAGCALLAVLLPAYLLVRHPGARR